MFIEWVRDEDAGAVYVEGLDEAPEGYTGKTLEVAADKLYVDVLCNDTGSSCLLMGVEVIGDNINVQAVNALHQLLSALGIDSTMIKRVVRTVALTPWSHGF